MAKFPEPPGTVELEKLGIRPDEKLTLRAGTRLWRVYFQGGPHPALWNGFRSWGPSDARFDHHVPPAGMHERKILYAAGLGRVCLAEAFQSTRTVDRTRRQPWLVAFTIDRDVRLLDLTGLWPTRAGASQAISSGLRQRAQRWSRQIYDAYPDVEGLRYRSSMAGGEPAVALYERAESAVPGTPDFHRALADPVLLTPLENIAARIGYVIV